MSSPDYMAEQMIEVSGWPNDDDFDADDTGWQEYWDGLSEEDREKERQMMAAYVEEKRQEREARGYDV